MAYGQYELPDGWAWRPLPQVAEITMGQSPPGSTYNANQTGLPFFQGKADFGELFPTARVWCDKPKKVAEPGDVLVSVRAPVGPTNIAAERCAIGRGLAAIRPKDGLPSRLLREYLVHIERELADRGTGSTFTAINKDVLESLFFPLPPLPEQERLVEKIERVLEHGRTAREALARIPPLLKRFRQSVLARAFRGELTERDPNDEPASVLLERIREERRRKWEEDLRARGKDPRRAKYVEPEGPDTSELPALPEGWAWVLLGEVAEFLDHMRIPVNSKERVKRQGPYPYYGANGQVGWIDDFLFDEPLVLLAEDGGFFEDPFRGNAYLVDGKCWVNNHAHVLRALGGFPTVLLSLALNNTDLMPFVSGTTRLKLTQGKAREIPIPFPPLLEQRRMLRKLEAILGRGEAIDRAVASAYGRVEQVDQAVLARAFRGEL